jgi:hypothetical protein
VENDDSSIEEEEEEEEEEDEELISSVPENNEISKLTQIIDTNHLLPDEFVENENRLYKPFHDDQKEEEEDDNQSTISTSQKMSTLSIDKDYVRAKVKQTLKKKLKQQHHRLCGKGETALITAQQRDQRETIQLHLE